MPISEEQLAANRANAAKSTGPCTPEGKARSARNARAHGIAVVRLLKADLTAVSQPVNSLELFALEPTALTQQADSWSLCLRYQAQAEHRRAVEEFDRLKSLRAELPNEPILEVQPKEKETTCAPPNEPISPAQPPAAPDVHPSPATTVNSVAPKDSAAGARPSVRRCTPVCTEIRNPTSEIPPSPSRAIPAMRLSDPAGVILT